MSLIVCQVTEDVGRDDGPEHRFLRLWPRLSLRRVSLSSGLPGTSSPQFHPRHGVLRAVRSLRAGGMDLLLLAR